MPITRRKVSGLLLLYLSSQVSRLFFRLENCILFQKIWPLTAIFLTDVFFWQGGIDDSGAASVRAIMHWQYRTIYRGQNSILNNLYNTIGPKAHDYISFYGLRAYGKLSEDGPVATSQVTNQSSIG